MQTGLVVGNFDDTITRWLIDPFHHFDRLIRSRLKLKLNFRQAENLEETEEIIQQNDHDILFFTINWTVPVDDTVSFLKNLYEQPDRPRIVYLDHYCLSSTPFFKAMPYVDAYVRKQLLTPISQYNDNDFIGKNIYSDFVARTYNTDLNGWEFGSKIPPGSEHKLLLGWNLGTANTLSRPLRHPVFRLPRLLNNKKVLDLTCRVTLTEDGDKNSMYYIHRVECMKAVQKLDKKYRVGHNANDERISFREFHKEMRQSRLGLSPFGWGEITDRDFRIVNSGTLLLKPDMSHLATNPDIYRAGETYAPVKWDFSDLEEVCEYYLTHPAETREMSNYAFEVYNNYYRQSQFVDKIEEIIRVADENYQ